MPKLCEDQDKQEGEEEDEEGARREPAVGSGGVGAPGGVGGEDNKQDEVKLARHEAGAEQDANGRGSPVQPQNVRTACHESNDNKHGPDSSEGPPSLCVSPRIIGTSSGASNNDIHECEELGARDGEGGGGGVRIWGEGQ